MITEYFEGWKKEDENFYANSVSSIHFLCYHGVESILLYPAAGVEYEIAIPQTLDQFISNCVQVGIELKWRNV
jgi:hypothetical protein